MTTPATLPETIRAHVHEDAINRVTRFFTASPTETMGELLQNARRAHATKVEVTIQDGIVTISDDGDGIHNPEAILGFGHADWNERTTSNEDPAGMGFYALSSYEHVTVSSRLRGTKEAWSVELNPDHFLGKSPATIQRLEDDDRHGTTITFQDNQARSEDVAQAARYFPLPVTCNGEETSRQDYLANAIYITEWRGIRIGVFNDTHRFTQRNEEQINFHGVTAGGAELPMVTDIESERWRTFADVRECPEIMLALPARRQVIQNAFLEEFKEECLRTIYQATLEHPAPVDLPYSNYQEAHQMGVPVPEARKVLHHWEPTTADWGYRFRPHRPIKHQPPADALVIGRGQFDACDQQILARAIDTAGISGSFMQADNNLIGYNWYDSLAHVDHLSATAVTNNEETVIIEETGKRPEDPAEEGRPDRLTLNIHFTHQDISGTISLETDVAFGTDEVCSPEEAILLVTKTSDVTIEELTTLLMDSFFYPSDDRESNSFDTQKENWEEECAKLATEFLVSDEEGMRTAIAQAVSRHVRYHLRNGYEADISIDRSRQIDVTIHKVEDPD